MCAQPRFPGGSKTRVNRAGDALRSGNPTSDDLRVFEEWRLAHRHVLNTFQALIRNRIKKEGVNAIVAQRHKRKSTIIDKLNRYPRMQLSRMDDVAGCRIILDDINSIYSLRGSMHKARVRHILKNGEDKYDYIKRPKHSGYRGIHDIYSYIPQSYKSEIYKGLLIEIQYRTKIQHSWATTVEIIGNITENDPKFNRGDEKYMRIMALSSEILSRAYESRHGPLPEVDNADLVKEFLFLDRELNLISRLSAIKGARSHIISKKNVILVLKSGYHENIEIYSFEYATDALENLIKLEEKYPDSDVVLVRANTSDDVLFSYKNYFSDAKDFVDLIRKAILKLS